MEDLPEFEIEQSPLYDEFIDVQTKCPKESQNTWQATFHLGQTNTEYHPISVESVTFKRDYASGFADEVMLICMIPYGKYSQKIWPNRDKLEVTLTKYRLKENSTEIDWDADVQTERYGVKLIEEHPIADMADHEAKDEYALDLMSPLLPIKFQIFNKSDERIRQIEIGGPWRKVKLDVLMKLVLTHESGKLLIDNKKIVEGVQMHPIGNPKTYEQVIIPHGLRLVDLAGWLHKEHGVYQAGIGSYVQNKNWYIYPLYDTNVYPTRKKTLTLVLLPSKKFSELERTYMVRGDTVKILCVSDRNFKGDTQMNEAIDGGGVRFTEADSFMGNFGETKGNKFVVNRKKNNNEFLSNQNTLSTPYAPVSENNITANPFVHYTDLAKRKGGLLRTIWQNSEPRLLEPGMAVKILYMHGPDVKQAYGVLVVANHMTVKVGDVSMKKHMTHSELWFFTNMKIRE